jgi:hypothetical protein
MTFCDFVTRSTRNALKILVLLSLLSDCNKTSCSALRGSLRHSVVTRMEFPWPRLFFPTTCGI